jgi:hypothetical protein
MYAKIGQILTGRREKKRTRACVVPAYLSAAPKPPLCKGRWHGEAVTEGLLCQARTLYLQKDRFFKGNPSVSLTG